MAIDVMSRDIRPIVECDDSYGLGVLRAFLHALDESGIGYALIHHRDRDLGTALRSDIDIAFDRNPQVIVPRILEGLSSTWRLQVVHCLHYEIPHGYYYMIRIGEGAPQFLHLDCLYDPIGVNRYFLPTRYFLEGAVCDAGLRHAAPAREAIYLLIKRAIKGGLSSQSFADIQQRFRESDQNVWRDVEERFDAGARPIVDELLTKPSYEAAMPLLAELRKRVTRCYRQNHPSLLLKSYMLSLWRKLGRFLHPTGYFVVLLGPDGSGKSTVSNIMLVQLERAFRKTWRFHWRPGCLPKLGQKNASGESASAADNAPAEVSKYRGIVSLARFVYYWLDFVVGYWLVIYPRKAQTTLVLGERYFPDVLVHPQRYGFSVPHWLMRLAAALVPSPDLIVLLKDEPEIIYARKPELSIAAIATQIKEYQHEMSHWGASAEIITQGGAEAVALSMSELILQQCAERTADRIGLDRRKYRWRAFPSASKVKVWVNEADSFANALNLYHPFSRNGQFIKSFAGSSPASLSKILFRGRPSLQMKATLNGLAGKIRETVDLPEAAVSFSQGTPGPHQKMTAQVTCDAAIASYVKISDKQVVKELLDRERIMLIWLHEEGFDGACLPLVQHCVTVDEWYLLFLSAPPEPGIQRGLEIDDSELRFLDRLASKTVGSTSAESYLECIGTEAMIERIRLVDPVGADLLRKAVMAITSGGAVAVCASHGDYAPWNTLRLDNGDLYVFDWEYGSECRIALWDTFHRLLMPDRLVLMQDPASIIDRLVSICDHPQLSSLVKKHGIEATDLPLYVAIYLLELTVRETLDHGLEEFMKASFERILMHLGKVK